VAGEVQRAINYSIFGNILTGRDLLIKAFQVGAIRSIEQD
jgi:hypothetical protein